MRILIISAVILAGCDVTKGENEELRLLSPTCYCNVQDKDRP